MATWHRKVFIIPHCTVGPQFSAAPAPPSTVNPLGLPLIFGALTGEERGIAMRKLSLNSEKEKKRERGCAQISDSAVSLDSWRRTHPGPSAR